MSTERRTGRKAGVFLLPVLTAAPIIAMMLFLAFRYGPTIRKLLNVMIKMAVSG